MLKAVCLCKYTSERISSVGGNLERQSALHRFRTPTDEAFAKLPAGTVENLLKPENKEKLVAMLTHHLLPGKLNWSAIHLTRTYLDQEK